MVNYSHTLINTLLLCLLGEFAQHFVGTGIACLVTCLNQGILIFLWKAVEPAGVNYHRI